MTAVLSRAEGQKLLSKPKQSKYKSRKVTIDGITFDSVKESKRYVQLRALLEQGEISHLELQPVFKIYCGGVPVRYDSGRQMTYRADFSYFDGQHRIVEDCKGYKTREYLMKKALVHACYPAVRIKEV